MGVRPTAVAVSWQCHETSHGTIVGHVHVNAMTFSEHSMVCGAIGNAIWHCHESLTTFRESP